MNKTTQYVFYKIDVPDEEIPGVCGPKAAAKAAKPKPPSRSKPAHSQHPPPFHLSLSLPVGLSVTVTAISGDPDVYVCNRNQNPMKGDNYPEHTWKSQHAGQQQQQQHIIQQQLQSPLTTPTPSLPYRAHRRRRDQHPTSRPVLLPRHVLH